MNQQDYMKFMRDTYQDLELLIESKNSDYTAGSDDAFANFRLCEEIGIPALTGLIVRVLDKVQRIKAYAKAGKLEVPNEGVDDAFKDLIGYSFVALALLEEARDGEI
jgi:hypothetical protein